MYCRDMCLRTGLVMPRAGWVIDLGANRGLFSVWAALAGAHVVAVEAQLGFAPVIRGLAAHNGVANRVHVEIAVAGGARVPGATEGLSPMTTAGRRPRMARRSDPLACPMPEIMSDYRIDRIGMLKADIRAANSPSSALART